MKSWFGIWLLTGICLLGQSVYSQNIDPTSVDYSEIDAHARSIEGKFKDLDKLSEALTNGLKTDHEKVRAVFTWITANIDYDTKAFHRGSAPISFTYSSEEELQRLMAEENERIVLEVIKDKHAVCDGYSRLFKTLCEKSGIQVENVDGYARNTFEIRGSSVLNNSNHTWNAVNLYNKWYLLDATWASGYTDPGVTRFTRKFREGYFLTPPDIFILDHFPIEDRWQLMNKKVSWNEFTGFPLIKGGFIEYNISDPKPHTGTIRTKTNTTVDFEFVSDRQISEILIHVGNERYSQKVTFDHRGDKYLFSYPIENRGRYVLTIFVNGNFLKFCREAGNF